MRQYEIARRADIHPTILSAILHGAIGVRRDDARVARVAAVLGLRPENCFTDVNEASTSAGINGAAVNETQVGNVSTVQRSVYGF